MKKMNLKQMVKSNKKKQEEGGRQRDTATNRGHREREEK